MIPPIIHQMWLDKSTKTNSEPPSKYKTHVSQIKTVNPHCTYMFWNMQEVETLFKEEPDLYRFQKCFQSMPHHIQKCDFARYAILYCKGGVYIDLDFHCYQPLDNLIKNHPSLLLVYEPVEHSFEDHVPRRLYNGFMGSSAKNTFWLDWMTYIQMSCKTSDVVMETTGPINFARYMLQAPLLYRDPSHFADTCDIIPIARVGDQIMVCSECQHRDGQKFDPQTYHSRVGNYTDTFWNEGTDWWNDKPLAKKRPCLFWIFIILVAVFIFIFIKKNKI